MKNLRAVIIALSAFAASTSAVFADIVDPGISGGESGGGSGGGGDIILPICLIAAAVIVIVLVIKIFRKK